MSDSNPSQASPADASVTSATPSPANPDAAAQRPASTLSPVNLRWSDLDPTRPDANETLIDIANWDASPVQLFVGRNGTYKSRTARQITAKVEASRYLSADRLISLTSGSQYGFGYVPNQQQSRGVPLDDQSRRDVHHHRLQGLGNDELYQMYDDPVIAMRVVAFIRRCLGRDIVLQVRSGFLDPAVRMGGVEYSLLREEGHGLRELVILLAAIYREDWALLIVDEPELHLHPAMTRLWLAELEKVCAETGRRAIVISHEPSLLRATSVDRLDGVWLFQTGQAPRTIGSCIHDSARDRADAGLRANPNLVADMVFSPRPVFVEGPSDEAALGTALGRVVEQASRLQTDLIPCEGCGGAALWHRVARTLGMDSRAVLDLDAIFDRQVHQAVDRMRAIVDGYHEEFAITPPVTSGVVRAFRDAAREAGNADNPAFTASIPSTEAGLSSRKDKLLRVWRDAGIWAHPRGTLEDVLGMTSKANPGSAATAASIPTPLDDAATWVAYDLDMSGELEVLLQRQIERIVNECQRYAGDFPDSPILAPMGEHATGDRKLAEITPADAGRHRITVLRPPAVAGRYVEFDRDSSPNDLTLQTP